jgi:DNA replication protein DnaC
LGSINDDFELKIDKFLEPAREKASKHSLDKLRGQLDRDIQ